MSKKMLIDAQHPEEVRVAVVDDDGKLLEMDVDTSTKKQIKGNIYLAKVIRVEPSLQAAFVDYGGHRHGFLPFSAIHPDYYQIPVADKEALKALLDTHTEDEEVEEGVSSSPEETGVEVVSGSSNDEVRMPRTSFFKKYKIQEVIHHGQVMLVQVLKEERGNKGAAITTYLSLAGRYSVLMPNNGHGAGISRKITNAKERKNLKAIVSKLPIPKGMSVIIRTAGQEKKKTDIRRDYDYLMKTWAKIRESTLESIAPALIHEEGNIIKRSLRDVFTPDIEQIYVEGEQTFKQVKEFVKLLLPSQAKKVCFYNENTSLFSKFQIEAQIESLYTNVVQLKSGGYLVIDQTEALVAVDVNSGRAIRERDLEETALKTNLEACDELARQLRLRDLAGLIVIDFIDMMESKNNAAVERGLREALRHDRARVQMGRITGFGLMEMSRQRLHSSVLESSYIPCPCCAGKGRVRSVESCAVRMIHVLETMALELQNKKITLYVPAKVAVYLLNQHRDTLGQMEKRYHTSIVVMIDDNLLLLTDYRLEKETFVYVEPVVETKSVKASLKKIFKKKNKEDEEGTEATLTDETAAEVKPAKETKSPVKTKGKEKRPQRVKKSDKAPTKMAPVAEENFKVVEQEPFIVFDARRRAKTTQPGTDEHSADAATGGDNADENGGDKKRTGWWNKLMP